MTQTILALIPFALFFLWLFLFGMHAAPRCPECQRSLSRFQVPWKKSRRQWIEGGYFCSHCQRETDRAGRLA